MLREFGWAGADSPARVMSFSYVALQRVQRLAPDLRLVMLVEKARHWPVLKPMVEDDWIVGPGIGSLQRHPTFARRLADSGREIHVWTVNTDATAGHLSRPRRPRGDHRPPAFHDGAARRPLRLSRRTAG